MFIGANVVHNNSKFGSGKIVDFEINSENPIKSKVSVKFDNGISSKFVITSFGNNGFFKTDDENIIQFVDQLKFEAEEKIKEDIKKKAESIVYIPSCTINEYGKEVSKSDWEKALAVADTYRFPNESRAVIMDSDLIFINASAAMRFLEARVKDCDKIYKVCGSKKRFLSHYWNYATKNDIEHIILGLDNE